MNRESESFFYYSHKIHLLITLAIENLSRFPNVRFDGLLAIFFHTLPSKKSAVVVMVVMDFDKPETSILLLQPSWALNFALV